MSIDQTEKSTELQRRGFKLGKVCGDKSTDAVENWQAGKPVLLSQICIEQLADFKSDIQQSYELYSKVLNQEEDCQDLLDQPPYIDNLSVHFESLGSSVNEGDDQEIETVLFDVMENDELIAEDLWVKASWLSFYEEDASLRFRFSFGVDLHEDVAADVLRQSYSALLAEAVFPESSIITKNSELNKQLFAILACDEAKFVERIVYFNAPEGGAYLHHDRERGHAGVVYAQLSGRTFWLALPRVDLIKEIIDFVANCKNEGWPASIDTTMQNELIALSNNPASLTDELESFSNTTLIHTMNETEAFVQQLIRNGHSRQLQAGDMLLLPQETADKCCWHSVFTIGEETGEALSFAIRGD